MKHHISQTINTPPKAIIKKDRYLHTLHYIIRRCDPVSHESAGGHGESTWHTDRLMPHQRTYNPLILPLSSPSPPPLSLLITHSPYHRFHHSFPRPHMSNNAPTHLIYPEIRAQKTSRACDSCVCNTTADTDGNNERTAGETSLSLLWLYCYVCLCIWCYIYEFITLETVSMYSGEIVVIFVLVLE